METHLVSAKTVDEIIDQLQDACSRISESVAVISAIVADADGQSLNIGTAYCVDERGYFVTALHVIAGQVDMFIIAEAQLAASLVAVDEQNDLAIVLVHGGPFKSVTFATALPDDGEIVGGLGYPASGFAVELQSYLSRYHGQVVDGIAPGGLRLDGDVLQSALSFAGGQEDFAGYSGGPLVNVLGQVVASTIKADDNLGLVVGPSAAVVESFVRQNLPEAR